MEFGALLLVPEDSVLQGNEDHATRAAQAVPLWPVVGKHLSQDWFQKVRRIGVEAFSVVRGGNADSEFEASSSLIKQGIEQLLLIRLGAYAELDLLDILQFHRQSHNLTTEVFDQRGPLGVEIVHRASVTRDYVERRQMRNKLDGSRYRFHGYANRLCSAQMYRDLVCDALRRKCALRPRGTQLGEGVWVGEQTRIGDSVRLVGPCFVGDGTVLEEGVTVGPFASIENDSIIDCGTTIEGASILPQTFLAAGLKVRHSIIDGAHLEHLETGTTVDLTTAGLGRRISPGARAGHSQNRGSKSRFWSESARWFHTQPSPSAAAMIAACPL